MNNEQYDIEKLEKNEIKKLFKDGLNLFFRSPFSSLLSCFMVVGMLLLSGFLMNTSLIYFFILIILPIFSFHFCQSNDNSQPLWKFDFRYFKFIPLEFIFFVIFITIIIAISGLFPDEQTEESNINESWLISFFYIIIFISVPAFLSFAFARLNFKTLLTLYCANKWQILHLNIKEDFSALLSFHKLVDLGYDKNKWLIYGIGYIYFLLIGTVFYFLPFNNWATLFLLAAFISIFHHFLYTVIKHICKDGGINDKVKQKSFKLAESM